MELTAEEVQAKLLKVRQEQGISETVNPIRSIVKKQLAKEPRTMCQIHNLPLDENWNCHECIKEEIKQRIAWKEEERIRTEKRAKEIAEHPELILRKIGIGKRHLPCSFDNYQGGDKVKSICMDTVKNPCDITLSGPAGTGKTHLAVAIIRELVRNQTIEQRELILDDNLESNALFITVPDLLLQIRQVFNERSDKTEEDIVRRYARVDYLLLDDLGAEKTTEWSITTLYTIIDQRYRQERPTIVTTNLSIEQIGSQISERIASRLSSGKVIKINAPDYRKKRG